VATESLLDPKFISQLEYLYIVTKASFLGPAAMQRSSRQFGVGTEFAEHRQYTAGDDFRYIDWSIAARSERLFLKLFMQEQEVPLYFLVDCSASMSLGRPSKLIFAKRLAAALGYIGLANLDPVVVGAFDANVRSFSNPMNGRGQVRAMLSELEAIELGTTTDIGRAVANFLSTAGRKGLAVIISDFFDRAGYERAIQLLRHNRYPFLMLQVNDRAELQPESAGDLELIDSETNERVIAQLTPTVLERYLKNVEAHYAELARLCKAAQQHHFSTFTDDDLEKVIFQTFRQGGFLR
jgi:uncharacterized protein (DUF58 family)